MNGNRFGTLLNRLMEITSVKNFSLASYLQYDVSYVSKWVNGKSLPAEKSLDSTVLSIANFFVETATDEGVHKLGEELCLEGREEIRKGIAEQLKQEYYHDKSIHKRDEKNVTPAIVYYPSLSIQSMVDIIDYHFPDAGSANSSLEIIACIDIAKMEGEYGRRIVNLNFTRNASNGILSKIKYNFIMNFKNMNIIRDMNLIVMLIKEYSDVDFNMYNMDIADNKFVFAVRRDYSIAGMMINSYECTSVVSCEEKWQNDKLFEKFYGYCNKTNKVFSKNVLSTEFRDGITVKMLLSRNKRLLIQYFNDFLVPPDIVMKYCAGKLESLDRKLETLSIMVRSATLIVILPKDFFMDFALKGEVILFGEFFQLEGEERKRTMEYLKKMLEENPNLKFLTYQGKASDLIGTDMYLSDTICAFGIKSERENNSLVIVQDSEMKSIMDQYWDIIMEDCKTKEEVVLEIDEVISQLDMISWEL